MKHWRLAVFSLLIALPAVMIIAAIGWFAICHAPRAIRYEPIRIGREYREIAERLYDHPELATHRGERPRGWLQTGKIEGHPWGYLANGATAVVWVQVGSRQCMSTEVPALKPFPYRLAVYGGGSVIALTLLALTTLAIACLVRFIRERDDFLAATAHDLTTPLVGMRLLIGKDDAEAKRLTERLLLIVTNLRDFLRLGGRRKPPTLAPVDVAAICRDAYGLFRDDYRDLLDSDVPIEADRRPLAMADETLLTQIFWNLFGNDLKYAAPFGKVAVRIVRLRDRIITEFADEGQGMDEWQMRRAFDRYYRARTAMDTGKGGFGIGLCTAREFAQAMDGELSVRANHPHGCVFSLSLAAATSD